MVELLFHTSYYKEVDVLVHEVYGDHKGLFTLMGYDENMILDLVHDTAIQTKIESFKKMLTTVGENQTRAEFAKWLIQLLGLLRSKKSHANAGSRKPASLDPFF
jgi:hypothetical protein